MSWLIEGSLESTRFESGRIEPHPEQIDPVALAADLLKAHQQSVSPTGTYGPHLRWPKDRRY